MYCVHIASFLTSPCTLKLIEILISRLSANMKFTFGFKRAQTLGALISVAFVWIITAYLVIEAVSRIELKIQRLSTGNSCFS